MLSGLPQISSVHCGLTTACCCCPTQVTNEYCCRQPFQNGPTQCCVNRIEMIARIQQMGIPAGTAITIQDVNHGCGWGGDTFALLWEVRLLPYRRMMPTSRGCIFITIKLELNLASFLYYLMHKTHFNVYAYRTEQRYHAFYWRHCNVTNATMTSLKRALTSFCYVGACNLSGYDSGDVPTCRQSS